MPNPLTVWITANCGKFFKEVGIPDHLTYLLRNLFADQETTARTTHETRNWFKSGKGYSKIVCCDPDNLTYIQSTSCEMPGWMNHKLESRLPGEISTTSDMQIIPP